MIKFDSYDTEFKKPFGAVRRGDDIYFTVKVSKGLKTDHVNVVLRKDKSLSFILKRTAAEQEYDVFTGNVTLNESGLYKYRFELVDKDGIMVFAGTEDGHTAKTGDWLPEWQLFIFDSDFPTDFIKRTVLTQAVQKTTE